MEFKNYSLIELRDLITTGKTTSEEIYTYFLDRTKKYNEQYNIFNTLPIEFSISSTQYSVDSTKNHLPIAVKDAFCEI